MRRSFLGTGLIFAAATLAGCAGSPGSTPAAATSQSQSQSQSVTAAQPVRTLGLEPAATSTYQKTVLKTKPLAYFPLNSPNQGSVKNTYSVTLVNGATIVKKGPIETDKRNRYLSLTGTQYATTSLSGGISGTGSMVAWVNLSELPSTAGQYFYISGETQAGNDFDLQFQNDNNLYFYTGQGENTEYTPDPSTLVGKWNMIAVTYDGGSAQTRDIYWNGALVATATGGVSDGTKTSQFSIGESLGFTGRYFQGGIDAVGIWGRALSAQEVANIYASAQ